MSHLSFFCRFSLCYTCVLKQDLYVNLQWLCRYSYPVEIKFYYYYYYLQTVNCALISGKLDSCYRDFAFVYQVHCMQDQRTSEVHACTKYAYMYVRIRYYMTLWHFMTFYDAWNCGRIVDYLCQRRSPNLKSKYGKLFCTKTNTGPTLVLFKLPSWDVNSCGTHMHIANWLWRPPAGPWNVCLSLWMCSN